MKNKHIFQLNVDGTRVADVILKQYDNGHIIIDPKTYIEGLFNLYDKLRNDILLNNIDRGRLIERLSNVQYYPNWLDRYEMRWGYLDNFYHQVYLYIKEDCEQLALMYGMKLNIVDNEEYN